MNCGIHEKRKYTIEEESFDDCFDIEREIKKEIN